MSLNKSLTHFSEGMQSLFEVPAVGYYRIAQNIDKNTPLMKDVQLSNNEGELAAEEMQLVVQSTIECVDEIRTDELTAMMANGHMLANRMITIANRLAESL